MSWPFSFRSVDRCASLANISVRFSVADLVGATENFHPASRLGRGSFGTVYHARLWSGTEAAVKVLPDADQLSGFEDEVRVLSRLRHPNLVTLLGWGMDDTGHTCFLVYELLTGGDLAGRLYRSSLAEQPFGWRARLHVAIDAARGLSYMVNSQPKVFHRDIKPPNILLDASSNAKIADFGLARVAKDIWQSHLSIHDGSGTPGYLSPELEGTGEVTEMSEVYSFGVVLLELLTNELPEMLNSDGSIDSPLHRIVRPHALGAQQRLLSNLDCSGAWTSPLTSDVAALALRCVHLQPLQRPPFLNIVTDLSSICERAKHEEFCAQRDSMCHRAPDEIGYAGPVDDAPRRTCPAYADEGNCDVEKECPLKCPREVPNSSWTLSSVTDGLDIVFGRLAVTAGIVEVDGKDVSPELPDMTRLEEVCTLVADLAEGNLQNGAIQQWRRRNEKSDLNLASSGDKTKRRIKEKSSKSIIDIDRLNVALSNVNWVYELADGDEDSFHAMLSDRQPFRFSL